MDYEAILLSRDNVTSFHYLHRYIKFINVLSTQTIEEGVYFEKHHILPSSLYPEFSSLYRNTWNRIDLTARQHYIAHFLLAKAVGGKMWLAFSMMQGRQGQYSRGILYEIARKCIAGKITVRDNDGNTHFILCDEYDPLKHIYMMTGRILSADTKRKIGDGTRGKSVFSNDDNEIRVFDNKDSAAIEGFTIEGNVKLKGTEYLAGYEWYQTADEGECVRVPPGGVIPEGATKGRTFNNVGFSMINGKNRRTVFDMVDKVYANIDINEFDDARHIDHGGNDTKIIVIDGLYVPYNRKLILDIFGFHILPDSFKVLGTMYMQKFGRKNNRYFVAHNKGKLYKELGITSCTISEYMKSNVVLSRLFSIDQLDNHERFYERVQ